MSINDFKAAAADLDDAVSAEPQNLQAWTSRGLAYERLGDKERAAGSYAKAINIKKDHEPAKAGFARLGGQMGGPTRHSERRDDSGLPAARPAVFRSSRPIRSAGGRAIWGRSCGRATVRTPEGFYRVTPELMNPHSNYYLAMNIGYPNSFDKANNRDGSLIMIHGDCWSVGCHAMSDEQISEIYALARESFLGSRQSFQVQAYPFRMTPSNLARHRNNPNLAFWKMLKIGNDHFEATHLEPKVDVCDRLYVFDAQRPPNSRKPLVFNPTGKCPAFVVDPKIARPALEKQRADEFEYAQLLKDNVPAVPIYSELDGGMNEVFLARFPNRVTLSKKIGLDLAQHPVELLMGAHQRMRALEALDTAVPAARRADEGIE